MIIGVVASHIIKHCGYLWLFTVLNLLGASLCSSHNSQDSQLHSAVILPKVIGLEQRCVDSTVQLAAGMSFA